MPVRDAGRPTGAHDAPAGLRAIRPRDARRALGMAVSYLMTEPAFARLPFGHWSRVLVGQVNRGHFLFVMRGDVIVGFAGWALTTKDKAEAWLTANRDIGFRESGAGDVVLVNAWKSESPSVSRYLVKTLRGVLRDKSMIYAKRFYPDGRVRPVRLAVSGFASGHGARAERD